MSNVADVERICLAALDLPANERAAFLSDACQGDHALRQDVESLLAHASPAEQFLEHPAVEGSDALAGLSGLSLGQRLGPYQIISKLGAGGMGEVYRARDTQLGREVAIKILPVVSAVDPERLARFEREARVLASLNHPHIAALYGIETTPAGAGHHVRALILELVEGVTLAERIARGPVPVADALAIARQIADALDVAHEKGIVHRDLKPANIKITPDGVVKVLDFGLAKAGSDAAARDLTRSPTLSVGGTHPGVVLGTAPYMSPEQARGFAVDKRTDIWAFGCVLYEMLSSTPAFSGATASDILAAVMTGEPNWTALPAGTPPNIQRLLQRCLTADSRQRLRDIGDARIELAEDLATESDALAASATPRLRHAAIWMAMVVLGVLAGSLATWRMRPPSAAPTETSRFAIPLPPGEQLTTGSHVAVSGDGRYVAFNTIRKGRESLHLRELADPESRLIIQDGGQYPFFSPDSQWLGFFEGGKLRKIAVQGGPSVVVADAPDSRGASWGDDGSIVFAPQARTSLVRVSANGGTVAAITSLETAHGETSHRTPELLPGAHAMVYYSEGSTNADGAIVAYSLDTKERHVLVPGGSQPRYAPSGHLFYRLGGQLMAVPFDVKGLQPTGPPIRVLEAVQSFDITDTGTLVYSSPRDQATTLAWVDRRGVPQELPAPPQQYQLPRLSPDGGRITMWITQGTDRNIGVYDIAGGALTKLTFEASNGWPAWHPDGRKIFYASLRPGADWGIFSKPSDGSGADEPVFVNSNAAIPRDVSPDGQWLAFDLANPETASDIWLLRLGEQSPRAFTTDRAAERLPAFSPDSRWIAYQSNESGAINVYVRPADGSSGKWQISSDRGTEPRWNPTGREIFYRVGTQMFAVTVTTDTAFTRGKPQLLFDDPSYPLSNIGANYDVARDGQRLLMIKEKGSEAASSFLQVMTNVSAALTKAPR